MKAYIFVITTAIALGMIGSIAKAIAISSKTYAIPEIDGGFYFGMAINIFLIAWGVWLLASEK